MDADDLLFLIPPPDYMHLNCPVCYEILLRDPHLVSCCGQHYCGRCITSLLEAGHSCPLCKSKVFQSIVDKNHGRALSSLKVYCTRKEKGCTWEGELGKLIRHTSADGDCEYSLVPCAHQCGVIMIRSSLKRHEESICPKRPTTCQYCNQYVSTWEDVTTKHYNQCPEVLLLCHKKCGAEIARKDISRHSAVCPLEKVDCEFANAGCKWSNVRKSLKDHMETSWKDHINLITKQNATTLDAHRKEIKQLVDTVQKQQKKIDMLTTKVTDLSKKLTQQDPVKSKQQPNATAPTAKTHPVLKSPSTPIFTYHDVRIKNFTAQKAATSCYKSGRLYLQTPNSGYCWQLRVYPNGTGSGEGSHISVFLHLIPGQYDTSMQWPFKGCVYVRLFDHKLIASHGKRITVNDRAPISARQRPTSEDSPGIGDEQFIAHSGVRKYLHNDKLLFEIDPRFY